MHPVNSQSFVDRQSIPRGYTEEGRLNADLSHLVGNAYAKKHKWLTGNMEREALLNALTIVTSLHQNMHKREGFGFFGLEIQSVNTFIG